MCVEEVELQYHRPAIQTATEQPENPRLPRGWDIWLTRPHHSRTNGATRPNENIASYHIFFIIKFQKKIFIFIFKIVFKYAVINKKII